MNTVQPLIKPDWRWGTSEGSRELDRLLDRRLTFLEKMEWLEEAETLSLLFQAQREKRRAIQGEKPEAPWLQPESTAQANEQCSF